MALQGRAAGSNLTKTLAKVQKELGDIQKLFLVALVEDIVDSSPVDSGTYVNGHTVETGVGSSGGQFTGPYVKNETSPNPEAEKNQALAKLVGQIQTLPEDLNQVSINNRVPHAYNVEYGGWSTRGPYQVYSGALNRANIHLQDAINTVKGRR